MLHNGCRGVYRTADHCPRSTMHVLAIPGKKTISGVTLGGSSCQPPRVDRVISVEIWCKCPGDAEMTSVELVVQLSTSWGYLFPDAWKHGPQSLWCQLCLVSVGTRVCERACASVCLSLCLWMSSGLFSQPTTKKVNHGIICGWNLVCRYHL